MREIKFRGRKINSRKWVVGNLGYVEDKAHAGILVDGKLHIVDIETVGQYTGIKDKKGVDIFEGDILEYGYVVSYVDGSDSANLGMNVGFYSQRDDFESWAELEVGGEYKIIGNIHEKS